jgi:PIN domain nuclease of toxin-antitoxin system
MHKRLLLDTHIWLWLANGDTQLSSSSRQLIKTAAENQTIFISAISVWEVAMLAAKGRIQLNPSCPYWIKQALAPACITLLPLSPEISIESCYLPGAIHSDPADRMLIASARIEQLFLLTKDEKLLNYGQAGYVNVIEG